MRALNKLVLRDALPADRDPLARLAEASLRELAIAAYAPLEVESLISGAGATAIVLRSRCVVLEEDGEIVGFGAWRPLRSGGAAIDAIYVSPGRARRGHATRIMRALVREIAESGRCRLEVAATLNAMPFFTRLGFRPARILTSECGHGAPVLRVAMAKRLPARLSAAASA